MLRLAGRRVLRSATYQQWNGRENVSVWSRSFTRLEDDKPADLADIGEALSKIDFIDSEADETKNTQSKPGNQQSKANKNADETEDEETDPIDKFINKASNISEVIENRKEVVDMFGRLDQQAESTKQVDKLLKPEDLSDYKPFYDPKYNRHKLTEKSSTYMDIIRLGAEPEIDIPCDVNVTDFPG